MMNNRNNNYKKQNGRGFKPVKKINNTFKALLEWGNEYTDGVYEEVAEVIETTKFEKISIAVSATRGALAEFSDSPVELSEKDASKVTSIGYIKSFDSDALSFDIVVFNNFLDVVSAVANDKRHYLSIVPVITTTKEGSLRTITKFILKFGTYDVEADDLEDIIEEDNSNQVEPSADTE